MCHKMLYLHNMAKKPFTPIPPMAELPPAEDINAKEILDKYLAGEIDLICVLGPTASGKTRYAVQLARRSMIYCGRGLGVTSRTFASLTPPLRFACGPPAPVPRVARSSMATPNPLPRKRHVLGRRSYLLIQGRCTGEWISEQERTFLSMRRFHII